MSTMARVLPTLASQIIICLLLSSFLIILVSGEDQHSATTAKEKLLRFKKQKFSHFRVYWHDIFTGKNPTAAIVVPPLSNTSATFHGAITIVDDPLTEGPELNSTLVGRAQGLYASTSKQEFDFLMAMSFVFTEGKYNGSTITIQGRNQVLSKVREMPVVGGSGLFRFATGYVEARTYWLDSKTGDATVEYNIYLLHY